MGAGRVHAALLKGLLAACVLSVLGDASPKAGLGARDLGRGRVKDLREDVLPQVQVCHLARHQPAPQLQVVEVLV